jgi:ABC-type transporter Mla subunit MlaD
MAPGCWVTSQRVRPRPVAPRGAHARARNRDQQRRQQLQEAVDQATSQVRTLNEQLEQARTQTRNIADIGVRFDDLETRLRTLTGALDELRHSLDEATSARSQVTNRVDAVERRLGIAPLVDASQIPQDNQQLLPWPAAPSRAVTSPARASSRSALLQRAAQDPFADDAQLIVARASSPKTAPPPPCRSSTDCCRPTPRATPCPTRCRRSRRRS